LVDELGERLIVPYYDPMLGTDTAWIPIHEIKDCAAVLVDVRWPQGSEAVLRVARAAGIFAVLDADVGPSSAYERLIPLASHIIFSEPAALFYSGEKSAFDAVVKIGLECDAFIAVTIGEGGCLCYDRDDQSVKQFLPPEVQVVDTLAAGDVFHGAFTLALAQGTELYECIRFANAAAALKCQTFGGRKGAPSLAEVNAILALQGHRHEG
jgi:sugar/nucleoside kinase (ribokinase family)